MFNGVGAKARPGDGLWTSRCGLERMGGVASAARFLGGGVVLGLLVAACGGPSHDGAAAGRGSVVSGYGLRVALPAGWSGRVFRASAKSAVELEAATVPPPPAGQFLTGDELGAGNAYVILDDLGKARRGFVSPRNGWETHPKLPLTLHRSDLHGPWDWQPLGRRESRFGRGGRSREAARRPQERDRQRQGVEVQLPRPIQVPDPYWL